jgi:very-short-patch-repair endonuclease
MDREMFYGAYPELFRIAELLRKNMTPAEVKLWDQVRKKQLGVRFKAQHPLSFFVVDFYCHKAKLVVELDGPIHRFNSQYDDSRQSEIEQLGIMVLRFKNEEVVNDIERVIKKLQTIINERLESIKRNEHFQ